MNAKEKDEETSSSTSVTRRFTRLISEFFVGLAIGLAPFLGTQDVPGFRALISVMPFQITYNLITLSALLMGLIVVAIHYYSAARISRLLLNRLFGIALTAVVVGFILFYFLRIAYTVDVERGSKTVSVLISSSPKKEGCTCKDPENNPEECIKTLSFNSAAIKTCWHNKEIDRRGSILGLSYLILTGGVGVLIGFLLLQEELRRQEKKEEKIKKEEEERIKQQEAQKLDTTRPATPKAPKKIPAAKVPPGNPEQSGDPGAPKRGGTRRATRPAAKRQTQKTKTAPPKPDEAKPSEEGG